MIKVLAITGYKPYELGIFHHQHQAIPFIKKAIAKQLIPLAEDGLEWVIISGQLGVELWAAEVVFDLQAVYPHLQLAILTPFLDQEENWNEENKEYYEFILSQADFVDSITKRKYENPGQFRLKNQFIVEKSDGLLIVYDDEKEGSPKFMLDVAKKKAETRKYDIFPITFYDLQAIIEEEQMNDW
ncbi:putative phage-like protein YoqJ [Anoxybacillus calidus]|jgi:uncharacterized phage-like protein YoqJ|uniref:UPF0398 protein HNQ85_002752 n=1 Tax=[Anoxybacillus] calidus TaxID=575178 RepID=A0A7V9Z1Z3_9BACL|nr:DUF1273 domain-containing protein [Anoxybacillus calidus]MBA2872443.1 putative phage-like protein YoqJ [Anoxybacillus calidus]